MCHHYVDDEPALEEERLEADTEDERVEDEPRDEDGVEPAPEPAADD